MNRHRQQRRRTGRRQAKLPFGFKSMGTVGSQTSTTMSAREVLVPRGSLENSRQGPQQITTPTKAQTKAQSKTSTWKTKSCLPYHRQTRRPLTSLLFVLPLILIYETSTLTFSGQAFRSGMDQWLEHFLSLFGLGQLVILPLVTAGILLTAHVRRQDHQAVNPTVLGWMTVESFGLGLILFWAANAFYLSSIVDPVVTLSYPISSQLWWGQTLALVGSGIYEELIFRLILLTLTIRLLYSWSPSPVAAWIGILVVSLIFAGLHYDFINPAGGTFELASFTFRFLASVVFSLLFLFRGFGIAVGAHIAFDVLTQL